MSRYSRKRLILITFEYLTMQHIDGDGGYFKCYNVMKLISDYDK